MGPIACISKKFLGFASCHTFCATLAAIGTADTPAAPISGFIFPPDSLFINFPNRTPEAVPMANANSPNPIILNVFVVRKVSAFAVAPTVTPKNIDTMFNN